MPDPFSSDHWKKSNAALVLAREAVLCISTNTVAVIG